MFFLIHSPLMPKASRTCLRRLILLCCLTLITTGVGCNQDRAQWKVAAAINEEKNGNPEAAIELLQTALRLDPDSVFIKTGLASLLAENDQGDLGLTLCDEVLESNPGFKEAWRSRSNCLMLLGRFDEALADYQKYVAKNIDKEPNQLNQLAYYRGLAGHELDKALQQINLGIKKSEQNQHWGRFSVVPIEISSVVSAGLISRYTTDGHLLVMGLLNDSILKEQQIWLDMNARFERVLARHKQENESGEADKLRAERQRTEAKRASDSLQNISGNLTVLLATRSLIFEDQGQSKLADLDRLWLEQIGFEPQELYDALPSDTECLAALSQGEAYLDTRGFILTQMPWLPNWTQPSGSVIQMEDKSSILRSAWSPSTSYGSYTEALRDLDLAVAAAEVHLLSLDTDLFNRIEIPVEEVSTRRPIGARMVAVLRNHRRQAHLKANQLEAAEQDLLRIQELGFEAGPCLF